jgi:FKBP-type peptidyl-prolyl cis-trans isomerase FkpA
MHFIFRHIFFYLASIVLFLSCGGNTPDSNPPDANAIRRNMLEVNAILIDTEDQEIKDFIQRHGWEMEETGSGLRYMIYEPGNGPGAQKDQIAVFHFSLSLITGDLIYTSENDQPAEFRIGRGSVESGLEEAILLLRVGDKARLILPSHLAHGLPGDGVKIPQRATIIYDIELLDLKQ